MAGGNANSEGGSSSKDVPRAAFLYSSPPSHRKLRPLLSSSSARTKGLSPPSAFLAIDTDKRVDTDKRERRRRLKSRKRDVLSSPKSQPIVQDAGLLTRNSTLESENRNLTETDPHSTRKNIFQPVTVSPFNLGVALRGGIRAGGREKTVSGSVSQNAAAGGLAGVMVSCCLHPIDTIKTVLQAEKAGGAGLVPTVVRVVQERGFGGLYRGLAANLTTAAPISAIYASTYEAVKGALIPRLPEGWTAVAHCMAGGAASVATAAVYTPSEAIKQRLQLGGSQYKTSWEALVGVVRTEGVGSLYTGVGAVLCRNVPQSVIKFWAYEALKGWALKGKGENARVAPGTQLVIGGVAGSTAALFTTPFDVIKTRLQTQLATGAQYRSVYHALVRIWAEEGLPGLYRGLVPRLVIYVSQGAIFFASYEILKGLMATSNVRMHLPPPPPPPDHISQKEPRSSAAPEAAGSRSTGRTAQAAATAI
eukprot:TRINITY_DN29810_c0_g1_i1.p1 TRINITY_DN29810_c0_g1~~TRINITY_DN29810_c0_g1_i1.p1  ORF type:complete len:477 (+),score=51.68 TRINITY_DN29810_c0_g1_i1:179-1609(+)